MRPSDSSPPRPKLSLLPGAGRPEPPPEAERPGLAPDAATQLGLYLGYDRARVALGRLAAELGRHPIDTPPGVRAILEPERREEVERAAQAAALAAFALICEQAEALRRSLCQQWPELRQDCGGPVPVRLADDDAPSAKKTPAPDEQITRSVEPLESRR